MNPAGPANVYLAAYHAALEHQKQRSDVPIIPAVLGPPQPWQTCLCHDCRDTLDDSSFHDVKRRYAWAVPDEQALDVIEGYSPQGVVEIGAGAGYWARMLRGRGVDVVAYDPDPPCGIDTQWHMGHAWSKVKRGDHTAVAKHGDRTLLLVWPSYNEPWAAQCLDRYAGSTVIYVGEGAGGCTADNRFHAMLGDEPVCLCAGTCTCTTEAALFECVADTPIPQWQGIHDWLSVYQRLT